jgi:pimeloyl-ACP methyl ester carboxylesterase
MRGRGDSTGKPDANGWELNDVVDAVEFAKKTYASRIAAPELVYLTGGSGGGGNVLGLVGKFPDYFCSAVCLAGISDYGLWYQEDQKGEFRDELEKAGWIGGTPVSNPEGYASRGGLTTVGNLLTPLLLIHGELDDRCRVNQARNYVEKARGAGKESLVDYLELSGTGIKGHFGGITPQQNQEMRARQKAHLAAHGQPIEIPPKGRFVVAGYLKTKRFEVVLDHIDHVAEVVYDLEAGRFDIRARAAKTATVKVNHGGKWTERESL